MPWWIPLVMPTATFIHSHLPPLPGFAPVVEIEDEEYILVDHDPYEGTKNEILPKPALKSTDERLAEEQEKEKQLREERRSDSGIFVEPKSRRESKGDEKRVAKLLYGIDKEIVEREDEPFDWRWFGNADIRNKDIYIYNKRRLLLEIKLKSAAETKHFLPLGRDTSNLDADLRTLDMARQHLDRRFAAKYDYIPPRETWAGVEQENTDYSGQKAIIKGVIRAAYGVNVPFL